MKVKKIMMMALLLLFILTISAVSATDNETSDNLAINSDLETQSLVDDTFYEVLGNGSGNTFSELSTLIENTPENSVLELDKNYENNVSISSDGITISKAITIDGKGHLLDAKGFSRIFNITAGNVTLKNIAFKNGKCDNGGAIYWTGAKGTVTNCSFENNTADTGGAIHWYCGDDGTVTDCIFENNNACAIDWDSSKNGRVINSTFSRNSAYQRGGSIHWHGSVNGTVSGCNFTECYDIGGGAIFWHYSGGSISDCNFVKNTGMSGGAIRIYKSSLSVSNSNFVENTATQTGGAISGDCSVHNCTFVNNTADSGGAIYEEGWCPISYCTFIDNHANSGGGAIGGLFSVSNSIFVKNTASYGGAICGGNNNIAINCTFKDCSSNKPGGAIEWVQGSNIVTNCTFMNCSSNNKGGAMVLNGADCKVDNSTFINSKGSSAKAIYVVGDNSTISNSRFEDKTVKRMYDLINQGIIVNCTLNGNKTIMGKIEVINSINEYNTGNFTFKLTDLYTDEPIEGAELNLYTIGLFNTTEVVRAGFSATTDANGIATFTTKRIYKFDNLIVKQLEVGNHAVELTTGGNIETGIIITNLTITPANINITVSYENQNASIIVTDKDGEAMPNVVLLISIDNLYSYTTTDENGQSTVNLDLTFGEHILSVCNNDTKNMNHTKANMTINILHKTFDDLSILIANTSEGNILELNEDYQYSNGTNEGIQISKAITIDGKGHELDALGISRIFYIASERVTLKNIVFKNGYASDNGGAINFKNGIDTGNITNCTFTNNKATSGSGGAVFITWDCGITNCNFFNNTANTGGAVHTWNGEILNCTFTNNTACNGEGGAVCIRQGSIENSNFTNNHADNDGGAVYCLSYGNVTNCNFVNNNAKSGSGGAILFWGTGEVRNCNFTNNTASDCGGAVRMNSGTVENCNFTDNSAGYHAGAVFFDYTGTVENCNFIYNKAPSGNGGAVYFLHDGEATNCNFTYNSARNGGASYFEYSCVNTVANCNFNNNSADNGGAIYFNYNSTVENCNFNNNKASGDGGAIYVNNLYKWNSTVTNCSFTNNTASNEGGAVYFYGNGDVTNCDFTNNKAVSGRGGAIYFNAEAYGMIEKCNFINCSADNGNCIYILSGSETLLSNCNFINCSDNSQGLNNLVWGGTVSNCTLNGDYTLPTTLKNTTTTLEVNSTNIHVKEEIPIKVTVKNQENEMIAGDVEFYVNGILNRTVSINEMFTYTPTAVGTYTLEARFNSDETYSKSENNQEINVIKIDPTIIIDVEDILYGESETVKATLPSDAAGSATFSLYKGNTLVSNTTKRVINGASSYEYEKLNLDVYTINVQYEGDDLYEKTTKSAKFTVRPIVTISQNVTVGNNARITMALGNATGQIIIKIDGEPRPSIEAIKDGKIDCVFSTENLTARNHTVTFDYYYGNSFDKNVLNYWNGQTYVPMEYNIYLTPKEVEVKDKVETDDGILRLEINATGTLKVFVDGVEYTIADIVNGIVTIDLSQYKNGEHVFTFEYSGDDLHEGFTKTLTVHHKIPEIIANNLNVVYTSGKQYTITIYEDVGVAADNVEAVITLNGKAFKTLRTNTQGVARFEVTQTPGTYKITITSLNKTVTRTLTVKHIVTLKKVTVKRLAKKLVLQATLTKVNGKYLKNKKIKFKFNGKKYNVKTNKKGVAKVTIKSSILKKLKVGKKVTYQATYLKDTVKKTVKIKK